MPVPILLVVGFLGAGKTTVVNHLLAHANGLRIAALVNDFGAINIDAALIQGASDGVISLANGCICCTLEGDLLRTLATLMRRTPPPEAIIIETSGIADPADIVRNLMDPVIFQAAPLETVLCVIDTTAPLADPLLRAQLAAADLVALSRTDLADPATTAQTRRTLTRLHPKAIVLEAPHGQVPLDLLFTQTQPSSRTPGRRRPVSDRFESFSWTSDHPISLPKLQHAIGQLAPRLARAKGLFEPDDQPGRRLQFHLAGGRATLAQAGTTEPGTPLSQMVFIAEIGAMTANDIDVAMDKAVKQARLF